MNRIDEIKKRLTETLTPTSLEVIDDSAEHIGHAGAATGMGHFTVIIGSEQFSGKTPIACHRLVYEALGTLMQTDIHALQIKIVE